MARCMPWQPGTHQHVHACSRARPPQPRQPHSRIWTSSLLPAGTLSSLKGVLASSTFLLSSRLQRSGARGGLNLAAAAASASPSVCMGGTLMACFCSGGPA
jgi:hypothetical protein